MKKLSIHTFMHVPYEGLGCMEHWIAQNNHSLSYTHFYENYHLPNQDDIDWLIIMGGSMSVNDETKYPWLVEEKEFIRKSIKKGKTVIGICLGSQLIAEVLGAKVYPNKQEEIGWFDIKQTESANKLSVLENFEEIFPVFHWHGDTFDLPDTSTHLFRSEVCENQAFLYHENVLGLQFHFEITVNTLKEMVVKGASELIENETIQSADEILNQKNYIENNNLKMFHLLDYFWKNEH